jgi:His-Xaa-Ser system protein HxsD
MFRTHPIRRTLLTIPVRDVLSREVVVEFDCAIQSIGVLQEAAYRLIGLASCVIERAGDRYVCRLVPKNNDIARSLSEQELRQRLIDLVTDEALREKVAAETAGVRDVIVALAFGALAQQNGSA